MAKRDEELERLVTGILDQTFSSAAGDDDIDSDIECIAAQCCK